MPNINSTRLYSGTTFTIPALNMDLSLQSIFPAPSLLDYHIYYLDQLTISQYAADNWEIIPSQTVSTVKINTLQHFNENNIYQGNYGITYRIYRNGLGSVTEPILYVHEISPSRQEVRIALFNETPELRNKITLLGQAKTTDENGNLLRVYLNFGDDKVFSVLNWQLDPVYPYTIVYKLFKPLPEDIIVNDICAINLAVSDDIIQQYELHTTEPSQQVTILKNPNWNAKIEIKKSKKETDFYNWDQLLSTNPTSSYQLVNKYFSGSLQGVDLNIDYTDYNNFVFYSSAESRLNNFQYKLGLIENYTTLINSLNTQVSNSYLADTITLQNNIDKYTTKLHSIFGTFDGYDNYMYYGSSSAEANCSSWPKQNSEPPYTLYSVNSETGINFFESQLSTASLYDTQNVNALINTVPEHVLLDESNIGYVTFIEMVAQHFDILWLYTSHLSTIYNRQESLYSGLSKDLVYSALKSLGWDPEFGNQFEELWYSTFGGNNSYMMSSDYVQVESEQIKPTPKEDISKQIWKRILNNLPFLLKNKGTAQGIRALINCYGIPDTILRIKEYGGPDKYDSISKYTYEKFTYAWEPTGSNNYYLTISGSDFPETIEFRFKTIDAQDTLLTEYQKNQTIFTNTVEVTTPYTASVATVYLQTAYQKNQLGHLVLGIKDPSGATYSSYYIQNAPIYDGNWWSFMLRHTSGLNYDMFLKQSNGVDVSLAYSASITIPSNYTSSINYLNMNFPGDVSSSANTTLNKFGLYDGMFQDIRYWNTPLSESAFDNHVISTIGYNGNTLSSSYYDLVFRLPLGTEAYLSSSTQLMYSSSDSINFYTSSKHPNDLINTYYVIGQPATMSFVEVVEQESIAWPDCSANRVISNKIRIEENNAFNGNTLGLTNRTEISAYDKYPNDSAKIGVYLSPTNEINEDIAQHMGGFRIDDYIGDEEDYYTDEYPELNILRNEYFKKYKGRYKFEQYIRLLKFYDHSLFNQIKTMLPYRSRGLVGLVIEPHILERPKFKLINKPVLEEIEIYSTLNVSRSLNSDYQNIEGAFENNLINFENEYSSLSGSFDTHPSIVGNDYESNELYIDINSYMSFDNGNPLQTMVTGSTPSSNKLCYSLYIEESPWLSGSLLGAAQFPLEVPYNGSTGRMWSPTYITNNTIRTLDGNGAPLMMTPTPTIYDEPTYMMTEKGYYANINPDWSNIHSINGIKVWIRKKCATTGGQYATDLHVKVGNGIVNDITIGDNKADRITSWASTYQDVYYGGINDRWGLDWTKYTIKNLQVGFAGRMIYSILPPATGVKQIIDYIGLKVYYNAKQYKQAQVQDFEPNDLANLKYRGCKITSADFNQPSLDTPDGGPAVEFHIVNSTTIDINPTVNINPTISNINNVSTNNQTSII